MYNETAKLYCVTGRKIHRSKIVIIFKIHKNCGKYRFQNWDRGYKLFSYSTQLKTKFILLINVKMPTIVCILTFMSRINTTSDRLKAKNFFICRYFSFYEQLKFPAQLS